MIVLLSPLTIREGAVILIALAALGFALYRLRKLVRAYKNEREWTRALTEDSKMQSGQLDAIATALGISKRIPGCQGRNDRTDLVTPIITIRQRAARLEELLATAGGAIRALQPAGRLPQGYLTLDEQEIDVCAGRVLDEIKKALET